MSAGDAGTDEQVLDADHARVFLCLFYHQTKLGIAYYDEETGNLHVSETWESEDFSNVQLIKMQVNPSMILVGSKADEDFMAAVTDNADSTYNFVVKILATKDFVLESARNKIATLDLLDMPESLTSPLDRLEYFASLVDFENTHMVRAAGALVYYLQRNMNSQLKVNNIINISSENYMFVDTSTLHSLQIFSTERHPSLLGKGKAKEGLSLFGITDHTKSSAGKRLLREWFLRPTVRASVLEERLEAVAFFVEGSLSEFISQIQSHLKRVSDLSNIVLRFRRASASIRDWQNVLQTALHAWEIRRLCSSAQMEDLKIYEKIMTAIDDVIQKIADLLEDVIDFEESKDAERIVIQHGIDEELDEAKQQYSFLDEYLTEVGKEEMQQIDGFENLQIIYYPQIGFLISIPNVDDPSLDTKVNLYSWDFQYETDESIFFKNERMHELDESIGDIHNTIADMERAIAMEVETKVLEYSQQLIEVTRVCAELDCILSLAITARDKNYVRPTITDENVVYISNGRHPLQELCVDGNFIPNDTSIAANREGSVKLITGPNYSGKSVYLKQVGLITYMAHVGSFVPADGAIIGLCDQLFTRIHTRETASLGQSSFMIDCHQVALMTRHATERSLLLVDEFGKGTNPNDGMALLFGTMEYLLRKEECPKVLVTTHFARAVQLLRQQDHPNLEFVTLEFIAEDEATDEITFLYRLVGGVSQASYGLQCCESAGLPSEVVKRAKYTRNCFANLAQISPIDQFDDVIGDTKTLVESFLSFEFSSTYPRKFLSDLSKSTQKRQKRKLSEESPPFQYAKKGNEKPDSNFSDGTRFGKASTRLHEVFKRGKKVVDLDVETDSDREKPRRSTKKIKQIRKVKDVEEDAERDEEESEKEKENERERKGKGTDEKMNYGFQRKIMPRKQITPRRTPRVFRERKEGERNEENEENEENEDNETKGNGRRKEMTKQMFARKITEESEENQEENNNEEMPKKRALFPRIFRTRKTKDEKEGEEGRESPFTASEREGDAKKKGRESEKSMKRIFRDEERGEGMEEGEGRELEETGGTLAPRIFGEEEEEIEENQGGGKRYSKNKEKTKEEKGEETGERESDSQRFFSPFSTPYDEKRKKRLFRPIPESFAPPSPNSLDPRNSPNFRNSISPFARTPIFSPGSRNLSESPKFRTLQFSPNSRTSPISPFAKDSNFSPNFRRAPALFQKDGEKGRKEEKERNKEKGSETGDEEERLKGKRKSLGITKISRQENIEEIKIYESEEDNAD
eukprot:Phypoly_transcript_00893.p1 GENE.Phypoly_transcript_00893~~Phypoly_transcript_00893.p1  ORF type:complete len:1264 (+),score=288.55 Phypoly_transcript_00893:55-3846(+)